MRKIRNVLITTSILIAACLLFPTCRGSINVAEYPVISKNTQSVSLNALPVEFSVFRTGTAQTQEAFVFNGGSLFRKCMISHVAIWVKHPSGNFLFDTGLRDSIDNQFKEMSFLHKKLFKYNKEFSVKSQLRLQGINPYEIKDIILSHLHWDHASGIKDFPWATIHATEEEHRFIQTTSAQAPAFLKAQYEGTMVNWSFLKFKNTRYEVFDETCDYFGDGSVIFVKLPGHTLGSLGMFINQRNGKRFFFTGDVTWNIEGFRKPASKHFIPSSYVDLNKGELNQTIVKIHQLMKQDTSLIVIPAHDYNAQKFLKHFPKFQ